MRHPVAATLSLAAVLLPVALYAGAQAPSTPNRTKTPVAGWTPSRTADGQPDLQGIWTNGTLTPFERPAALAGKASFTEAEAVAYEKERQAQDTVLARQLGDIVWLERSHIVKTRRTSLVIDPPDGKVPPMTSEAKKKFDAAHEWAKLHPADGAEDRELTERCLLFGGMGPPMLPEGYGNHYQIIQTPGYVTLVSEMVHNVRVIPLDGRPRLAGAIRQWKGDSRGHWKGHTLIVETTNMAFNGRNRFGLLYDGWTDENLRITERFTRTDPDTIIYEATVEDPTAYTRPWTVEMSMTKGDKPLFEYACHEGNYGLANILSGARAEEKGPAGVPK